MVRARDTPPPIGRHQSSRHTSTRIGRERPSAFYRNARSVDLCGGRGWARSGPSPPPSIDGNRGVTNPAGHREPCDRLRPARSWRLRVESAYEDWALAAFADRQIGELVERYRKLHESFSDLDIDVLDRTEMLGTLAVVLRQRGRMWAHCGRRWAPSARPDGPAHVLWTDRRQTTPLNQLLVSSE